MRLIWLFILSIALTIASTYILNITELISASLSDKLTYEQIKKILDFQKKWEFFSYLILIVLLVIKIFLITSVLYIGTFFFSKLKVSFKELWKIVVNAEFIFLGVSILKIIWFYFFNTNSNLEDIQHFYPLSALNIIGYQGIDAWFIYPLQALNLFELVYWLVLSYFVGKLAFSEKDKGKPMDLGFKIVASSYGSALLLWVVVVMFFTLNYS